MTRRWIALAVSAALVLAACGGGDDAGDGAGPEDRAPDAMQAIRANYELVAGRPQRVLVGLQAGGEEPKLIAFGDVRFDFGFLGTRGNILDRSTFSIQKSATFLPIPGQDIDAERDGPVAVAPSEGTGVYKAAGVEFPQAGFWRVRVTAELPTGTETATADFEVLQETQVPGPGDQAPRTDNPTVGADGVDPQAIDSRATGGAEVPDADLHETSVADALAAGRPVLVVVSTPVYCVSRFCGPITDMVDEVEDTYGDRMAFVHIEVWEDFQAQKINPAAAEWIAVDSGGGANEPWVWLVGSDGVIVDRWDNVATRDELTAAIEALLAG